MIWTWKILSDLKSRRGVLLYVSVPSTDISRIVRGWKHREIGCNNAIQKCSRGLYRRACDRFWCAAGRIVQLYIEISNSRYWRVWLSLYLYFSRLDTFEIIAWLYSTRTIDTQLPMLCVMRRGATHKTVSSMLTYRYMYVYNTKSIKRTLTSDSIRYGMVRSSCEDKSQTGFQLPRGNACVPYGNNLKRKYQWDG